MAGQDSADLRLMNSGDTGYLGLACVAFLNEHSKAVQIGQKRWF
jgi:hypothetical protein